MTVFFAAVDEDDRTALANALIAVNRLAHALNDAHNTLVMGPQQASTETAQRLGILHGMRGDFDPMLVSDVDYQDAYLGERIRWVGFEGLRDDEQALLEVMF